MAAFNGYVCGGRSVNIYTGSGFKYIRIHAQDDRKIRIFKNHHTWIQTSCALMYQHANTYAFSN